MKLMIRFLLTVFLSTANEAETMSLADVMVFATGASSPPPLGFDQPGTLSFLDEYQRLPMANTCTCNMQLPVCYTDYEEFKSKMVFSIKNSPSFGHA